MPPKSRPSIYDIEFKPLPPRDEPPLVAEQMTAPEVHQPSPVEVQDALAVAAVAVADIVAAEEPADAPVMPAPTAEQRELGVSSQAVALAEYAISQMLARLPGRPIHIANLAHIAFGKGGNPNEQFSEFVSAVNQDGRLTYTRGGFYEASVEPQDAEPPLKAGTEPLTFSNTVRNKDGSPLTPAQIDRAMKSFYVTPEVQRARRLAIRIANPRRRSHKRRMRMALNASTPNSGKHSMGRFHGHKSTLEELIAQMNQSPE